MELPGFTSLVHLTNADSGRLWPGLVLYVQATDVSVTRSSPCKNSLLAWKFSKQNLLKLDGSFCVPSCVCMTHRQVRLMNRIFPQF